MKMRAIVVSGLGSVLLFSALSAFGSWTSSMDAQGHTVYTYNGSIVDNGFTFSDISVRRFQSVMSSVGLDVQASSLAGKELLTFTGDFTGNASTGEPAAGNQFWTD